MGKNNKTYHHHPIKPHKQRLRFLICGVALITVVVFDHSIVMIAKEAATAVAAAIAVEIAL